MKKWGGHRAAAKKQIAQAAEIIENHTREQSQDGKL